VTAMLASTLPTLDDVEGDRVPPGIPPVVDAHVHVFPNSMFTAVRRWFDENAWHMRYELSTLQVFDFLFSHGVSHVVALQYAHAPGMARGLNRYMAEQCGHYPGRVTGMATVFPGESDGPAIVQEAFDAGLGGLKLHAHVQCFDINAAETMRIFEVCARNGKPVVIHFGREPKSPVYRCDPYLLCAAGKLAQVLNDLPELRICVPHLGFSETGEYRDLIETIDNLWLDTTMVLTDYFEIANRIDLRDYRLDRIMYGSDFPNIPYAWDRELKWLHDAHLSNDQLDRILHRNAMDFFGIDPRHLHSHATADG